MLTEGVLVCYGIIIRFTMPVYPPVSGSHLAPSLAAHSEAEQSGGFGVALHLKLSEGCSMAFDGLGHLPVHRVQLHGPHHTVLLQDRKGGMSSLSEHARKDAVLLEYKTYTLCLMCAHAVKYGFVCESIED